jgi:hypothetical protein
MIYLPEAKVNGASVTGHPGMNWNRGLNAKLPCAPSD